MGGTQKGPEAQRSVLPALPALVAVFGAAHAGQRSLTAYLAAQQPDEELRRLAEAAEEETGATAMWIGLTLAATLTKLTSSTDDVVWLFPFLSGRTRNRNMLFYIAAMQFVVCLSWGFCAGGSAALGALIREDSSWPLAKILQLISAILLTLYTGKLLREWWLERQQADDEESEKDGNQDEAEPEAAAAATEGTITAHFDESVKELGFVVSWTQPLPCVDTVRAGGAAERLGLLAGDALISIAGVSAQGGSRAELLPLLRQRPLALELRRPAPAGAAAGPAAEVVGATTPDEAPAAEEKAEEKPGEGEIAQAAKPEKFTLRKLFTISMFGSLDDFAVYVSVLLSGLLSPIQLFLGTFFGSVIVVIVCVGAGKFACLTRTIERVPLWCIIGAFSVWTYISTFALD